MSNVRDAERKRQTMRELREWYIDHGLCPDCSGRGRPANPWVTRCKSCLQKCAARHMQIDPETGLTKYAAASKRRRERLREAGLCLQCGKSKPEPGRTLCNRCQADRNDSVRKYRILKRMDREAKEARQRSCR